MLQVDVYSSITTVTRGDHDGTLIRRLPFLNEFLSGKFSLRREVELFMAFEAFMWTKNTLTCVSSLASSGADANTIGKLPVPDEVVDCKGSLSGLSVEKMTASSTTLEDLSFRDLFGPIQCKDLGVKKFTKDSHLLTSLPFCVLQCEVDD